MMLNRVIVDNPGRGVVYSFSNEPHNGCDLLELTDGADWHYGRDLNDKGYISVWFPEFQGWSVHYFEESK